MIMRRLAIAALVLATSPAAFAAGTVTLTLGGEAYDGPPEFTVSFAGKEIGSGRVDAAIDTRSEGRFAAAADKAPYLQTFTFPLPDAVFAPDGELAVTFTNEAYGGDGSDRDRNLYVVAASVNGRVVLGSGFTGSDDRVGDYLALLGNNATGTAAAPAGGWPAAPAEPEAATVAAAEAPPAGPAITVRLAGKPAVGPEGESVEVASLDTADETPVASSCGIDEIYNVVGFNESSNDLTPSLTERLDQIIADIGGAVCTVRITGYSSNQGAIATNALFAIERAQNVYAYLRANGLKFADVSATGGGGTDQFGDRPSLNRRVVIRVTP